MTASLRDTFPAGAVDSCDRDQPFALDRAIETLALGGPVVLDSAREGAYLMTAAASATAATVATMVRHGSGFLVGAAPASRLDDLGLPVVTSRFPTRSSGVRTAHAGQSVSFDARNGVTTGISASDRARALALLADPRTVTEDLVRPGHVVAVRTHPLGVLGRAEPEEAGVELAALAGHGPAAGLCALLDETTSEHLRGASAARFAAEHGLVLVSMSDVMADRLHHQPPLERRALDDVPTRHGRFTALAFRDPSDGSEHVALQSAGPDETTNASRGEPLVAIVLECRLGHELGSAACGCATTRDAASAEIAHRGGTLIYVASRQRTLATVVAAIVSDLDPRHRRIRLLRPASACSVPNAELDGLVHGLRRHGVIVSIERLLGPPRDTDRAPAGAVSSPRAGAA